jgi:hypothetical protein
MPTPSNARHCADSTSFKAAVLEHRTETIRIAFADDAVRPPLIDGEVLEAPAGFDYSVLEPGIAGSVLATVARIRRRLKKMLLEDVVAIGKEILVVRETLPHGEFTPWLKMEFGWAVRHARNFLAVARRFAKTEINSPLPLKPTVAYLLARPSTPDEAFQEAIARAEAGERITMAMAREIVDRLRKPGHQRKKARSSAKLRPRLASVLERFRDRWSPEELEQFVQQLRSFADSLEKRPQGDATSS